MPRKQQKNSTKQYFLFAHTSTHTSDKRQSLSDPVEASSLVHWNAVVLSEHRDYLFLGFMKNW